MNTEEKMIKARVQLLLKRCFYGNLALSLPLIENNEIKTIATDGKSILYNKEYAEKLSHQDREFIVCHELLHIILYHLTRENGREHERWNLAIDYATNLILKQDFGFVPSGGLYDVKYLNMSAEEIYNKLPDMADKSQKSYSNSNSKIKRNKDGSLNVDGNNYQPFDEHKQVTGSKEEISDFEKDWKIKTVKSYETSKKAGKHPLGMDIFIDKLLSPKLDWRSMMRQFIISTAKSDYRMLPPNRRYIHADLYLPSLVGDSLGDIVVIIDNSGSTQEYQQRFFSECNALLQQYDVNLHLLVVDMQINFYKVYNKGDTIDLKQKGCGGTDITIAFSEIRKKMINPSVIVCLTDAFSPMPKKQEYPTLWVLTSDADEKDIPFGQKVKVEK